MSKQAARYHKLSGLINSDSDDGQNAMPTPDSAAENMPPPSRPRGRPKAASGKVTKPKTVQRRLSGKTAKGKRGRRPVLSDRTNQQNEDTEEVDEFEDQGDMKEEVSQDELDGGLVAPQHNIRKAPVGKTRARKAKTGPSKILVELEAPANPATQLAAKKATKKGTQNKKNSATKGAAEMDETIEETQKVIQETQPSPMDLDVSEYESIPEPTPRLAVASRARPCSPIKSRQPSMTRRRPGSASDTERSDPAVRRKLGDMTKKFENLDLKYRNLRDVGIKEAVNNFERLSKQCEEKTRGWAFPPSSCGFVLID